MSKPPGVLCLEGDWGNSLEERMSIEPALRLLERSDMISLVHRDVATRRELEYLLDKWLRMRSKRYNLLCLAFHGSAQTLHLGAEDITLDEIADLLKGKCDGKTIYLGSCSTLSASDDTLREFCRKTRAKAIVGYTRTVEWVESVAFELILVSELAHRTNMKPTYDAIVKKHRGMASRLGFRMAHADWVSPRRIDPAEG
ncbi:DUF6642 family protein [Prescottella agglutinans]|uniref:DUF6642 family protein n=1 Tax=Prescottella agglutinans TaxID=1644129 RepID=UPI003D99FD61